MIFTPERVGVEFNKTHCFMPLSLGKHARSKGLFSTDVDQ